VFLPLRHELVDQMMRPKGGEAALNSNSKQSKRCLNACFLFLSRVRIQHLYQLGSPHIAALQQLFLGRFC